MKDKQEIIDCILSDFDNRIFKMRNQLLSNIDRVWKAGRDTGYTEDEAYQHGLDDAWEAAKKILLLPLDDGLQMDELYDIFGLHSSTGIIKQYSPQEAVAKIREYEERKKKEEDDPFPAMFAGCDVCVHSDLSADDMPCRKCKYNYLDYFRDRRWKNG